MQHRERPNSGWTRVALSLAIVVSMLLISFNRGAVRESSRMETLAQDRVAPLAEILAVPARRVEAFFDSLSERASALEDNVSLREEIMLLRDRQARYDNLAMKVARYETILGVDTETDVPLKKIAARSVGEIDGPFVRSLILNVGSKDGVSIGNPVMSPDGLVGHVINVGPRSTRVLRLSDLNSRIAVASAESDATAILAGDNTADPKLAFINAIENWKVGDRVITSGDDGAMPRGLAVGSVVLGDDGGLRVELATSRKAIDWVWVSPYEKVAPPTEVESPDVEGEAGP